MKESAIEARNLTRASDVEGAIRGTYDKLEYGLTAPVSFAICARFSSVLDRFSLSMSENRIVVSWVELD